MTKLVSPAASPMEFVARYFGQDSLFNRISDDVMQTLPRWSDINKFLEAQRYHHPRVRLEREGKTSEELNFYRRQRVRRGYDVDRVQPDILYKHLRDGSTLVIDALDEVSPILTELAEGLTATFLGHVQTNAYITFGSTRGFGLHWDDHDVFVVQLEGRKQWYFYGSTRSHPLFRDVDQPDRPEHPKWERILERGDMVYVPRGYWHDVVGLDQPSFHITIGLNLPSGTDLISWLADKSREEEVFRRDLSLFSPNLNDDLRSKLSMGLESVAGGEIVSSFFRERAQSIETRPHLSLPYGTLKCGDSLSECVVRPTFAASTLSVSGDEVSLETRGRKWTFDVGVEPLFRRLNEGQEIRVRDGYVECQAAGLTVSWDEWLEFVDDLIAEHLIFVID